jgi:hypothetical protein
VGWKLALKASPFIAIGLLLMAVLWLRGNNAKIAGERDQAVIVRDLYKKANDQNKLVIEGFAKQRIDNDAIATAVASKLEGNRARTEQSRRQLREAQNDPNVRNWANQPVPNGMRRILETPPRR